MFKNAETVELKDDSVRVAAEECPKSAEVIVEKRVAVCVGVTESKKEGRKKTLLGRTDTPTPGQFRWISEQMGCGERQFA